MCATRLRRCRPPRSGRVTDPGRHGQRQDQRPVYTRATCSCRAARRTARSRRQPRLRRAARTRRRRRRPRCCSMPPTRPARSPRRSRSRMTTPSLLHGEEERLIRGQGDLDARCRAEPRLLGADAGGPAAPDDALVGRARGRRDRAGGPQRRERSARSWRWASTTRRTSTHRRAPRARAAERGARA